MCLTSAIPAKAGNCLSKMGGSRPTATTCRRRPDEGHRTAINDEDPILAWMDFCHGHYNQKTRHGDYLADPYPKIAHA
jgi:hypothetical protein